MVFIIQTKTGFFFLPKLENVGNTEMIQFFSGNIVIHSTFP